jgi:sugar phosphate isomerase/epimerase
MTAISRREFGRLVIASVPLAAAARPTDLAASPAGAFGVTTSSFRDMVRVEGRDSVDEVIRTVRAIGATRIELALTHVEPAPPSTAPFLGGSAAYPRRVVFTPQEIARTNRAYRASLGAWRTGTRPEVFEDVRARFAGAGIAIVACALNYDDTWADDEIDATFRQIRALGVPTVTSALTMATAARLVPFAERHRLSIAVRNEVDGNPAGAIATAGLGPALALSPVMTLALDIGNLTASNGDAAATLAAHQQRVSYVVVKDRLQNGGASQPLGEGDTPIARVLRGLETSRSSIPALVEYDYVGLRSTVEELTASLAYMKRALE